MFDMVHYVNHVNIHILLNSGVAVLRSIFVFKNDFYYEKKISHKIYKV